MPREPPLLDVEDDVQRQNRIGTLLARLSSASSSSSVSPNSLPSVGRERVPGPVKPPSELLARINAFLPAISASNEVLSQQNPEDINIENVSEDEEQYIEMNLGLGVFDMKPRSKPGSRPTSPSSDVGSDPTRTESESDSDSESSSSSSGDDSDYSSPANDDSDAESQPESPVELKPISSRPIKPLPQVRIEV